MPVPLDMDVVREVLGPYGVGDPSLTVMDDGRLQYWVRAADGSEAEIFVDEASILVERPHSGPGVFAVVAELASRLGAAVLKPNNGVLFCSSEAYARLPMDLQTDAVAIEMTGEALRAALIG
ncbi:hypothetical protein [Streptomyces sp. NPDC001480]|uniref:hypothetical protein n=1 Tax=Streptomyces sp. NPDC001480 TaxID=3364577 RepID=UPI0036AD5C94